MKKSFAEAEYDYRLPEGEVAPATGGYTDEGELEEIDEIMKKLKSQMEVLNLQDLYIELFGGCRNSSSNELPSAEIPFQRMELELKRNHRQCAQKVYDYMLKCLGLRCPRVQQNDEYTCVAEAIMGICMLCGDTWRKRFEGVKKIGNVDYFVLYCGTITVEKDELYFFNYLMRMAIIFEIARYCFDDGFDYFAIAMSCTYWFVDFLFFRDEGSWPALKNAASVIAVVTRPLRFVVTCPKNNVKNFADVVQNLQQYATQGLVAMTRREISLLKDLKDKFVAYSRSCSDNDRIGILEAQMQALLCYFRDCLPKDTALPIQVSNLDSSYLTHFLESLKDDGDFFHKALEEYNGEDRNTEAKIQSIYDAIELLKKVRRAYNERKPVSACATPTSRDHQRAVTGGKILKKQKASEYFSYDKKYVKDVIDLYEKVLPSFLKSYAQLYIAPAYEEIGTEGESLTPEVIFLIEDSYYKRRKELINIRAECKRMLGAEVVKGNFMVEMKTKPLQIVPLKLQRLLDNHIKKNTKNYRLKFQNSILAVPGVDELEEVICPIWHIKGHYEKNFLAEALPVTEWCERELQRALFRTIKEETDEAAVLKFRFRTTANKIQLPGQ